MVKSELLKKRALSVIQAELKAIKALSTRVDSSFIHACEILLKCKGHVVVTGMGKSGHIARKIAATFASTGTPAFFIHPSEANHGDIGMITSKDVLIAISNSGETIELLSLVPIITQTKIPLITLTGNKNSTLAKHAVINLNIGTNQEACSLGLVPTCSTTVTLVMGDALAVTLLEARGFTKNDFAKFHPGGDLGRRLLLRVADIMHTGKKIPKVYKSDVLSKVLIEVTQKTLGMTTIVSKANELLGVYTDGDLRRTLDKGLDIHKSTVEEVMSTHPITISSDLLASEALALMEKHKITSLVVVDNKKYVKGVIHIHDLF
jgi:arabinose-5-phosphate isomerase